MEETKIIYHVDDQETPYLIKIPKVADQITLLDLKNALNKFNYKYFFKSMDDDFGVVKEEILDEKSKLPSFNGRIITWLVTSESSVSDNQSQCADVTADDKNKKTSHDNISDSKTHEVKPKISQQKPHGGSTACSGQMRKPPQLMRPPLQSNFDATSSVVSSDIDTTSFVDSDDETHTRCSTSTPSQSTRHHAQKKKKRRHKLPVLSQASSFSSITDSTMSLNIVTITFKMDTAEFLGISVVGQSTRGGDGGIYVGSIMKDGAVAQDGRIEPGDMILEVNGISFENMSNDDAVRTLREAVQRPGPVTLVVAKCWDPNPKGYFTIPRQEPVRPIDPSAWVMHSEAMRGMWAPRAVGPPSVSSFTSATSSLISSVPPNPNDFAVRPSQSSATSSSSHSSKSYADLNLTKNVDMSLVVRAMAQLDSGLDIRDRMWLKIPIPQSFIGSELVDWLYTHVEGFADRRDARRYACSLLKYGFIQHTVNKISFSEQCYYIFGNNVIHDMSAMSLADDIDSVSSVGTQQRDGIGPLPPPPTWNIPTYQNRPTYPLPLNVYNPTTSMMIGPPSTPYNYVNDGASYISMPGYNGAESVISSVKRDRTCACIVTHTYKQIRKLWDNPDKPNHPTSRHHQISTNTNSPLLGKMTSNKFNPDIDQSTSSDTDSDDSASSQSKNSKDMSKQTGSSSTTKTGGCDSGVGSVGACGDRSLPPLPGSRDGGAETSSSSASSRQQTFRLAPVVANSYLDDSIKVMGEL